MDWQVYLSGLHAKRIAWLSTAVLALLTLLILGQFIYAMFANRPQQTRAAKPIVLHPPATIDVSRLHLFGMYLPKRLTASDVPKTLLNLRLVGVMQTMPASSSQALIGLPGEVEKLYFVGDTLPGGARIYRILTNGIIIQRNGQLESLPLPKKALAFAPAPKLMRQ